MIHANVPSRPANRPIIAATWFFTLLPLVLPYRTPLGLGMATLFTLLSNSFALYLVFSPVRTDRLNGAARLGFQLLTFLIGAFILYRSGVTLDSLYHVLTHMHS